MTATEFSFLALGLVLGLVSGAALIEVLRARPPVPRDVRLTIAEDAVPRRRGATLSDDAFITAVPQPARGGPADRRLIDDVPASTEPDRRTAVRSTVPGLPGGSSMTLPAGAVATAPLPGRILAPAYRLADPPISTRDGEPRATILNGHGVAHPPATSVDDPDPILTAVRLGIVVPEALDGRFGPSRGSGALSVFVARPPSPSKAWSAVDPQAAVAVLERPIVVAAADAEPPPTSVDDAMGTEGVAGVAASTTDTCAAERRIAAERCGLAVRARAGATEAAETMRAAQRAYDDHMSKADIATETADPRAVRREKEAAQARFRQTYDGSHTTDDAEAAARDWLIEINDINTVARSATTTAKRERAAAAALASTLERLGLEADAARIAAESAEAACLTARQALADCDERSLEGITPPPEVPPEPAVPSWSDHPGPFEGEPEEDEPLAIAFSVGGTPTIFRLVRGDRSALIALVERLSSGDTAARRRWQGALTGLVDGIVAVSIEAGALVFPSGHHFWGMFTETQDREIAQALSSLGHRFDGLGGFVDDRVPSQRDLALALGYAGIDPMRMRPWPTETEMAVLYKDVTVAADQHLAVTAGDLSLAELVALLGRRADALADLWNEWGRIRPLLLEGA